MFTDLNCVRWGQSVWSRSSSATSQSHSHVCQDWSSDLLRSLDWHEKPYELWVFMMPCKKTHQECSVLEAEAKNRKKTKKTQTNMFSRIIWSFTPAFPWPSSSGSWTQCVVWSVDLNLHFSLLPPKKRKSVFTKKSCNFQIPSISIRTYCSVSRMDWGFEASAQLDVNFIKAFVCKSVLITLL